MPAPINVSELRTLLRMVTYYSAFTPAMRDLLAPLDRLLQEDVEFEWSKECQAASTKLKTIVESDMFLTHYNPDIATTTHCRCRGQQLWHRYRPIP